MPRRATFCRRVQWVSAAHVQLRQETSRRLRIHAKYEEACSFLGPFRVLTARWSKKQKKSRYTGHILIFYAFPLFYQDYTKRDGNFKSRPISLAPTLVRLWKAETISYTRVAFVSLALPHKRAASAQIRLERRNVCCQRFFEMTNVAAISTIGFTHCCGDQGLL